MPAEETGVKEEGAGGGGGGGRGGGGEAEAGPKEFPPLDFSTFILSLSTSVLMNLGVVENPMTGKKEKEPAVAKQTIELITLLREKTKGNLTEEETRLFED